MTIPLIQRSNLRGRLVIDQQTAEEVGRIDQLFVDVTTHQVLGARCKLGLLGRDTHDFKWEDINSIGIDSVLIHWQPVFSLEAVQTQYEMIGLELWTDAGNKVGSISDYCLHQETGQIIDYLFFSSGWQGVKEGAYRLPTSAIISIGNKRMIVRAAAVEAAEHFAGGLQEKLTQAVDFIKEDYAQTQADMSALMGGAQTTATKLQDSAQQMAVQAQDMAASVQDNLQTAVQQVAGQVAETAASVQTQLTTEAETPEETLHLGDRAQADSDPSQ